MRKASTGRKASRETREKISASGKKRYIEKGNPNKGLKRSDEYKKKQSKLLKEIYKDKKIREKISIKAKEWWEKRKNNK